VGPYTHSLRHQHISQLWDTTPTFLWSTTVRHTIVLWSTDGAINITLAQLRLSGMSRFEYWKLSNVSANIVVAILRVNMEYVTTRSIHYTQIILFVKTFKHIHISLFVLSTRKISNLSSLIAWNTYQKLNLDSHRSHFKSVTKINKVWGHGWRTGKYVAVGHRSENGKETGEENSCEDHGARWRSAVHCSRNVWNRKKHVLRRQEKRREHQTGSVLFTD
jgi:hypothetical protein